MSDEHVNLSELIHENLYSISLFDILCFVMNSNPEAYELNNEILWFVAEIAEDVSDEAINSFAEEFCKCKEELNTAEFKKSVTEYLTCWRDFYCRGENSLEVSSDFE